MTEKFPKGDCIVCRPRDFVEAEGTCLPICMKHLKEISQSAVVPILERILYGRGIIKTTWREEDFVPDDPERLVDDPNVAKEWAAIKAKAALCSCVRDPDDLKLIRNANCPNHGDQEDGP